MWHGRLAHESDKHGRNAHATKVQSCRVGQGATATLTHQRSKSQYKNHK